MIPHPSAVAKPSIHTAPVIYPVNGQVIHDGALAIQAGSIVAIGSRSEIVSSFPDAERFDWPGVISPGLVNAHTHLQYTSFADVGATPSRDFTEWSKVFGTEYDRRHDEDWQRSTHDGAQRMLTTGTTCIADVVTDFEVRDVLYELSIPGVAYLEILGVDQTLWEDGLADQYRELIITAPTYALDPWHACRVGLSPHAPYSVDMPVQTLAAELARELGVRIHTHVAESDSEDEFCRTGTGELAERVRLVTKRVVTVLDIGGTGLSTAEFVASLGVIGPDCHIAHGVYLGGPGRAIMAEHGTIVALCPRSNYTVGIDYPPVADFLTEAVPFAVGTDSLGSSPSLDLCDDVATLYQLARDGGYDDDDLGVRLWGAATITGARSMGLDPYLGSLDIGKRADFAVFDLPIEPHAPATDVANALATMAGGHCLATIIGGTLRHARG